MTALDTLPGSFDSFQVSPRGAAAHTSAATATATAPTPERPMAEVPVGILRVTVIKAADLLNMDYTGHSDPYVELAVDASVEKARAAAVQRKIDDAKADELDAAAAAATPKQDGDEPKVKPNKKPLQYPVLYAKTATETDTGSPVFHEAFTFPIHALGGPQELNLEVYDEDSWSSDDLIGRGRVDLKALFAVPEQSEPLVSDALPLPAPAPVPVQRDHRFPLHRSDSDEESDGGRFCSTADAGLTPRPAACTVWVPLLGGPDKNGNTPAAGKVLLLVHYVPRTRVQRAKERISGKVHTKVSEAKTKLTGKVTSWLADKTASQIKASFRS
ncbi:hypothetical protein H9P43_002141 [Blastocladiella emersonii ATCC 22665]|nr:hypothetical protein H9P43_002141 [Blastocladiella emersonii ATCC 22665]